MNLILSGPIDGNLVNQIFGVVSASRVVRPHKRTCRFEASAHDENARFTVRTICESSRVDHAYVPPNTTLADFAVLAMDMDSTLITIECIDELADFAGKKTEVAEITTAAMRGDIQDFAESLRRRVTLLQGLDIKALDRVYEERLALSPGAEALINAATDAGLYKVLASGGFTYFAQRLSERFNFDVICANQLEIHDQRLTGGLTPPIIDAHAKACTLRRALSAVNAGSEAAIAIGDGANDLEMLRIAGASVAYHAKPIVASQTTYNVRFGGLDVILDYFPPA